MQLQYLTDQADFEAGLLKYFAAFPEGIADREDFIEQFDNKQIFEEWLTQVGLPIYTQTMTVDETTTTVTLENERTNRYLKGALPNQQVTFSFKNDLGEVTTQILNITPERVQTF